MPIYSTDINPLTYIFDKAKLDAVGHRLVASLSNYNFNLTYRAGKANGDADSLSRIQPETKQMFHDAYLITIKITISVQHLIL
jgi:hypothetical protein